MITVVNPETNRRARGRTIRSACQNLARDHMGTPRYPRSELAVWAAYPGNRTTFDVYRAVGVKVCRALVIGTEGA